MDNIKKYKRNHTYFRQRHDSLEKISAGYLLVVTLALGLAISIAGITALSAVTSSSSNLLQQNYTRLTDEAAKAGIKAALDCIQNQGVTSWSTPLTPSSDCAGNSTRTSYVYQNSNQTLQSSYSVPTPTAGSNGALILTSTGTVTLNGTVVSTKAAHSVYRTAIPVQYRGFSQGTSTFTIPAHNAGDIIVVFNYCFSSVTCTITPPAAGGTVPAWQTIDANPGTNQLSTYFLAMRVSYAIATSSSHTSGTWTGATGSLVAVLSGEDTSAPIGGHAEADGGVGGTLTSIQFPSMILSKTNGASQIIAFSHSRAIGYGTYSTVPAGYSFWATGQSMFLTRSAATSYQAFQLVNTGGSFSSPIRAAVVEITAKDQTPFRY